MPADRGFVFISYARHDRRRVAWIEESLAAEGYAYFIDNRMSVACEWDGELTSKIMECSCLLVVWSSISVESKWVVQEVALAESLSKRIIPVRISNIYPPQQFSKLNAADLTKWQGNRSNEEWQKVLSAIKVCGLGQAPALVALIPRIKSRARDASSVAENQMEISGRRILERSAIAKSKEEFNVLIQEYIRHGYRLIDSMEDLATVERINKYNIFVAILLTIFLIIPGFIYRRMHKKLPHTDRVTIILRDGASVSVRQVSEQA